LRSSSHLLAYEDVSAHATFSTDTVNFAQAAKEAGVAGVINLSQRSASRTSISYSCQEPWISEQVFNWSGLAVTHLRPTYFVEWLLYPWQLPLFLKRASFAYLSPRGDMRPLRLRTMGALSVRNESAAVEVAW
jgi:uncharacterized protein YbjT (DUF2867 family)